MSEGDAGLHNQAALESERRLGHAHRALSQMRRNQVMSVEGGLHGISRFLRANVRQPRRFAAPRAPRTQRPREEQGWTQEQLAERAGMNASYFDFIERGDNIPPLMIIVHLAKALDVEAGVLLGDVMRLR